jgi:hypothetical protein
MTLPALDAAPTWVRAQGLNVAGAVFWAIGDLDRAEALQILALAARRDLHDAAGVSRTLQYLGKVAASRGDLQARDAYYAQAIQAAASLHLGTADGGTARACSTARPLHELLLDAYR